MKKQLIGTILGSALLMTAGSASAAYTGLQYDFYQNGTVLSEGSVASGQYLASPDPIFTLGDDIIFTESYDLDALTIGDLNTASPFIAWQAVWENTTTPGESFYFVEYLATADILSLTTTGEYFFGGPGDGEGYWTTSGGAITGPAPENEINPITAGTWAVNTYIEGNLQNQYGFQVNATVPEPAPLALMLSGLAAIGFASRKKSAAKK